MAYPVKWFNSDMQGAPNLRDPTAGKLAEMLKACLTYGFGTRSINTLAWDSEYGCAVATFSDSHKYPLHAVVEVFGVTPDAYNGEHRVKRVTANRVWFDLAGGNPGANGSGPMGMKIAGLGWTITHESADGNVFIVRPSNQAASGNVSLRVDNTDWAGWTGPDPVLYKMCFAKVQLVEDVQGLYDYTLIYDHIWPAAAEGFGNPYRWDLIGDDQLFYFLPAYGVYDRQVMFLFGYIKPIWDGDLYHAVLCHYEVRNPPPLSNYDWASGLITNGGTTILAYGNSGQRVLARGYNQNFGVVSWSLNGLFTRPGTGIALPNLPDSGIYFSESPLMVLETGGTLRGYLPGLVLPCFTSSYFDGKNFEGMPEGLGNITRMIMVNYTASPQVEPTLVGFDLVGPWR